MPNLGHRLYQDGETNFTLQAPDNANIAIFSIRKPHTFNPYTISKLDLRKKGSPSKTFIHIDPRWDYDKQTAVKLAYFLACEFASGIDPDFQDKTSFYEKPPKRLEQTAQADHYLPKQTAQEESAGPEITEALRGAGLGM